MAAMATQATMRKIVFAVRGCGAHVAIASAAPIAPMSVAMNNHMGRAGFWWEEFMGRSRPAPRRQACVGPPLMGRDATCSRRKVSAPHGGGAQGEKARLEIRSCAIGRLDT